MKQKLIALLALSASGCMEARALHSQTIHRFDAAIVAPAGLLSTRQCQSLLARRRIFGALGAGASVASGAGGVATIATQDPGVRTALVGTSLAIGIGGAVFTYLAQADSDYFSAFCTTAPP